ncbi:hypothetical protein C8Q77DRAFT_1158605 [Trametes polyzona]|nr:hypothetical protein C8Q77DRAFT_1158605 [Trametes polyzona]
MITVLSANVITACVECTFYGIFLVLAAIVFSLWVRRCAAESQRSLWRALVLDARRSPIVLANFFFLITISAHWMVGFRRLLLGVVSQGDTVKANAFFNDLSEQTEVIRCAFMFLDIFVGDLMMTYRTWVIWRRDYRVVVFPIIAILGLTTTSIVLMYELISAIPSQTIFAPQFPRWVIAFCTATLVTNTYGTSMIIYRIWATNRLWKRDGLRTVSGRSSRILEASEIFVESAALYSVWFALYVILYAVRSPLQTIGSGSSPALTGISFMLISVRVHLGIAFGGTASAENSLSPTRQSKRERSSVWSRRFGVGSRERTPSSVGSVGAGGEERVGVGRVVDVAPEGEARGQAIRVSFVQVRGEDGERDLVKDARLQDD